MIRNERQYKITRAKVEKLKASFPDQEDIQKLPALLQEALVGGIQIQIDDLEAELKEYEELKGGKRQRST